jgi:glycosyltransferase involved in cell wall biosynthesis
MGKPLVSIITPSYNQAEYLVENLESVAAQRSNDYDLEHLVFDGGSTDGSLDVLRNCQGVTWVSEPDRGQSDAINKGFRAAGGEIIGWINSDDFYTRGAVARVVSYFREHPDTKWIYGNCYFVDQNSRITGSYDARQFNLERLLNFGDYIPQQSTFFRRDLLQTVGYLDESLHLAMDYDFWIRIGKSYTGVFLPDYLACFRRHSLAKTDRRAGEHWAEALAVSRRHGGQLFSRLYFRSRVQAFYRMFPTRIRRLARHPRLEPLARRIR